MPTSTLATFTPGVGYIVPDPESAMTPGRKTSAVFDLEEEAVVAQEWISARFGQAISPNPARDRSLKTSLASNVMFLSSGAWIVRPWQVILSDVAEKPTQKPVVYTPDNLLDAMKMVVVAASTVALFRQPSGTGITPGSGSAASGNDKFFRKKVAAGSSWPTGASILAAGDTAPTELAALIATSESATAPIYPVARSLEFARADQGFCVRFSVPGGQHSHPGVIGTFLFGQFGLSFAGDGVATLYERSTARGTTTPLVWSAVSSFRYSSPSDVAGNPHSIIIFPHLGPRGEKYISFLSNSLSTASASILAVGSSPSSSSTSEHLYLRDPAYSELNDVASSDHVTIANYFYWQERQDLRVTWQITRLVFPTLGTLKSPPHNALYPGDTRSIETTIYRTGPDDDDFTITPTIVDYFTGSSSTVVHPYATFTLRTGRASGTLGSLAYLDTPILWGYQLRRAPTITRFSPGSFTTRPSEIKITGGVSDPRQEKATLVIPDPDDAWQRLRKRAKLAVKVQTTFTPDGGEEQTVTLFRGYAISPHRTVIGTNRKPGAGQVGSGSPSVNRHGSLYDVPMVGMYDRLMRNTTRLNSSWRRFVTEGASFLGWKCTDAVKAILTSCGFPSSMQRIPDLPIRFLPGVGQDSSVLLDMAPTPAQMLVKLCRDYLGRFLVFDPNDGADGKWTLITAPPSDSLPVAHFVRDKPTGLTLGHALASYPANTAPIFERSEVVFEPPSCNHLWAISPMISGDKLTWRVDNHLYNYDSYLVPGSGRTPDPDSPHYIGGEELYILCDASLWAGISAETDFQRTQAAVDYFVNRVFTFNCLAREKMIVRAPLLLVADAVHGAYRPLRFYDLVDMEPIGGGDPKRWFVRSVSPDYTSDRLQTAMYEMERIVPYCPPS